MTVNESNSIITTLYMLDRRIEILKALRDVLNGKVDTERLNLAARALKECPELAPGYQPEVEAPDAQR